MTVRQIVGVVAALGAVTGVTMVLLDMEPRLALVMLVVAIFAMVGWLLFDLAVVTTPVAWHDHSTTSSEAVRSDRRVQLLTSRLRQSNRKRRRSPSVRSVDDGHPADEVADTLLGLIDDHLLAVHGVDRDADAATAAALLGPELTRFATDTAARRTMVQRRTLARTVASIEAFVSTPPGNSVPTDT